MKKRIVTVRDLRLHFPYIEGLLAEGEPIMITKIGKCIAMLTKADPLPKQSLRAAFFKRFGKSIVRSKKTTHLAEMLVEDRGIYYH